MDTDNYNQNFPRNHFFKNGFQVKSVFPALAQEGNGPIHLYLIFEKSSWKNQFLLPL